MNDAPRDPKGSADDKAPRTPAKAEQPSAGPHAKPELTDQAKTPGTGMLPEPGDPNESPTG
ncbi:hypothetical protein [Rhodopseudomonas sp. B29]|uniref:hypothetical protein n=1 Tax=Rhodopseudomonas sp. B29 TaxID=95607 RepID=UPI0003474D15|nr:hypothetical protein [Rhodopseudomonas sp. B29]